MENLTTKIVFLILQILITEAAPTSTGVESDVPIYVIVYGSSSIDKQIKQSGKKLKPNREETKKSSMVSVQFYNLVILSLLCFSNAATFTGYRDTPCNGSIAECNKEDEILMESDISRRFLEQKYISPGALKPDQPVCEGANGESYSNAGNCLPPSSNPHDRGCSKYYRCRS
ncbi:protein RALF-like 32 [Ziziphus jujuba]|uniref:Protein RALF-like 32 n=1 Tax=Ziziphus jujuba TaxID=326968 RepID=A0A6P3ZYM8_ZIZJJ|nr:protein RALF-like 32 [Ziziphus jujuba]